MRVLVVVIATMLDIDLTPFGFTPTENLAYSALLEHGPSSGYALAKKLSIARANAYQALNGLARKGAAEATDERPQRYRPQRPDALLAALVETEARKLDRLEEQIRAAPTPDGDAIVPVNGERALVDVAMRTAAREPGPVTCLGPTTLLVAMSPAWRRRQADGRTTSLWPLEPEPVLPIEPAGLVPEWIRTAFGRPLFLLVGSQTVILAGVSDEVRGFWTADPAVRSLAGAALVRLEPT